MANVLDQPIHLPEDGEFGAAFGAARLGLMAAEGAAVDQVCTPPKIARTFEPDPALAEQYTARFEVYRSYYLTAS